MWQFCLRSLFRKYGWQFLKQMAAPHPVRTARALLWAQKLDFSGDRTAVFFEAPAKGLESERAIVGVGFCLKPMDPPCPSGRPNHDCLYLEQLHPSGAKNTPPCCRQCAIREIGAMALKAGTAFYVMTSARDILFDVFAPAMNEEKFSSGLFVLCRYSHRPFSVGLLVSGMQGWLFPLERGDCRDFKTWLQADRGIKEDRTEISEANQKAIAGMLGKVAEISVSDVRFERQGNVLYPQRADINSS